MDTSEVDRDARAGLRISRSILFGSFSADKDSISRLTVRGACEAIGLARSTFYYKPRRRASSLAFEHTVLRKLEELSRSFPTYGYRRLTRELRQRGFQVNPKRILRLMNLYGFGGGLGLNDEIARVHSDVSRGELPPVEAANRLWLAQLLRARVGMNLVHVAAVADVYSSAVIGFAVSPTFSSRLARLALYAAIRTHVPPRGCIHHSLGGEHYRLRGYSKLLKRYGIRPSAASAENVAAMMAAPGRSADIKRLPTYSSYREALDRPAEFVSAIYQLARSSMFVNDRAREPNLAGEPKSANRSPGVRTCGPGGSPMIHRPFPPPD